MSSTKKIAILGMLICTGLALSYAESLIPVYFGAPGIKPGFANLCILFLIYYGKYKEALIVNACRILIAGFLFGNLFGIIYSLAGAALSFAVMTLLCILVKKTDIMVISIFGGVFHNIAQFLVALLVLGVSGIVYYLPVLLLAGFITGFINGIIIKGICSHIRKLE